MTELDGAGGDWRWPADCNSLDELPTRAGLADVDPVSAVAALREPHRRFCAHGHRALLLVVQGVDGSGKSSLIREISRGLSPSGFRVNPFGPPSEEERRHDFLWRAGRALPGKGEIVAFNRSYYDSVLAERLWPVVPPAEEPDWAHRHQAIRDFERRLLGEGTLIIKCWLHISAEKQRRRLIKRLRSPRKRWKFDPDDLRNYDARDEYLSLASATLAETSLAEAPWYVVPSDSKKEARAIVAGLLRGQLEAVAPDYPEMDETLCRRFLARLGD